MYFSNALDKAAVVIKCPSLSIISTEAGPPTTITVDGSTPLTAFWNLGWSGNARANVRISASEAMPALKSLWYSSKAPLISFKVTCPPSFGSAFSKKRTAESPRTFW